MTEMGEKKLSYADSEANPAPAAHTDAARTDTAHTNTAAAGLNRQPLDAAALRAATGNWARVEVLDNTGSTNADVKELAEAGAPDRTAVVASNQTAGRGRLARQWEAPANSSIALSALFRPLGLTPTQLGLLPLACGLAVVDMIVHTAGIDQSRVGLKWPNDVLLDGRKVCGILVEAASIEPAALVPGIGVNVDLTPSELPVPHAISLAMAGAPCLDRTVLAAGLLGALDRRERQWRSDTAAMLRDYRAVCLTIGTSVRVELPDGTELIGTATDIRSDGELQVTTADGARHVVAAGDVSHVRATDGGYASAAAQPTNGAATGESSNGTSTSERTHDGAGN